MTKEKDNEGAAGPLSSFASRLKSRLLGGSTSSKHQDKTNRDPSRKAPATTTYCFGLKAGGNVELDVPMPRPIENRPATFVFGIYKGGSTLLNRMIGEILRESKRRSINLPNLLRQEGWNIDDVVTDLDGMFENDGIVFGGFRSFPGLLENSTTFANANRILMVRDPRDILVSLYFSDAYSHTIPPTGVAKEKQEEVRERALAADLNKYALENAQNVRTDLLTLGELLGERTTLVRYEDVIFDKPALARMICDAIGIEVDATALAEIAKRNDIRPEKEDKKAHIRNVSPGDHKNKLTPETIEQLNETLEPVFDLYYPDQQTARKAMWCK